MTVKAPGGIKEPFVARHIVESRFGAPTAGSVLSAGRCTDLRSLKHKEDGAFCLSPDVCLEQKKTTALL